MPDLSLETFGHYKREILKSLELHIKRGSDEPVTIEANAESTVSAKSTTVLMIEESQQKMLNTILADIKSATEPRVIFQKGLAALNQVDQQRFVMENMLEAVKRGESANEIASRYNNLGLISIPNVPPPPPGSGPSPAKVEPNTGRHLRGMQKQLKRVSLDLMRLAVNALKVIPEFVAIKPSIGFVAMMPSLSFELEGEGISIAELFEMLTESL